MLLLLPPLLVILFNEKLVNGFTNCSSAGQIMIPDRNGEFTCAENRNPLFRKGNDFDAEEDVTYKLFTDKNPTGSQWYNLEKLKSSANSLSYDKNKPTR